ncbi:MAG TPA: serine protein kinase RIO [Methanoregulaceae archaeon]|nr:serine protein kinase RIO [Methanoregulaceae archaeon]
MSLDNIESKFDREIEKMGVRIKDVNTLKVRQDVFDEITFLALYRLVHKKWITAIGGSISTGKEANVFFGERNDQDLAIKIYRIRTANFNAMSEYIIGDRRFSGIKRTRKDIVFTWTRKEYANLKRAHEAGLPVPEPLIWDRNILIMEFIGEGERAYPHIRNVELVDPAAVYQELVSFMTILYQKAELVHADLSEFNILYGDRLYVIDMGQAVTPDHPRALQFLFRDISNINRFFRSLCDVRDERELLSEISGIQLGGIEEDTIGGKKT